MATVQLRTQTQGRAYYDRRKNIDGKTSMEAMRALKRRLSDVVYRTMLRDALTTTDTQGTGPGGHRETATGSSATDSHPYVGSSEKSLPGPAGNHPKPHRRTAP